MSHIGIKPILIPQGITLTKQGQLVVVKGPKGELKFALPVEIDLVQKENKVVFTRKINDGRVKALHGLSRAMIANLIEGVLNGYEKKLEIKGVGYRARMEGNNLVLELGFSHPVTVPKKEGIEFKVVKNMIIVSGIDKQLVGLMAARIRALKEPEPYKGKGILYQGEQIRRKVGKAVGAEEGAAAGKPAAGGAK